MKNKKMFFGSAAMSSLVLLMIIFSSAFASGSSMDKFAKCITDSGMTFYGTDWCGHCSSQKDLFGDSLEYIDFVNCDFHEDECNEEGIYGYPTWKKNGDFLDRLGGFDMNELADITGCVVPE